MTTGSIAVAEFVGRVADNVETVILGKRRAIEYILVAILCRGHVLIEDVPGTGKTMLARAVAASLGLSFKRVQCTPDLLPNDLTGLSIYNQQTNAFEFRPGPVFAQVLLADEINRATPRTQSALLEAMQERQVTTDGMTRSLPDPFLVLATENPIEFEGTFPLPEAQIDRFLLRLPIGYPSAADEGRMVRAQRGAHPIDQIRGVAQFDELRALWQTVAAVHVDETVEAYIIAIVHASRVHPDVAIGVSPRGSLALYQASQALAALRGRDYVLPDDVKEMAPLTLTHRLAIRPESELRGRDAQDVLADLLAQVPLDVGERAG